ncbi:MAG: hypothetical protein LKE92_00840 [Atopobiaceae bacterium]|nr:hypothetical protein [Atopobiaceae bacterium]
MPLCWRLFSSGSSAIALSAAIASSMDIDANSGACTPSTTPHLGQTQRPKSGL